MSCNLLLYKDFFTLQHIMNARLNSNMLLTRQNIINPLSDEVTDGQVVRAGISVT